MPIPVTCDSCGKTLKAPDSAAGKKAKCPQCSADIKIPEPVYDAEEFSGGEATGGDEEVDEDYESDAAEDNPFEGADSYDSPAVTKEAARRPCPACGEMIVAKAVKCRFCGEDFDAATGGARRGKTRTKSKLDLGDKELLKTFQKSMNGIGGFCIFAMIVCLAVAGFMAASNGPGLDEDERIGTAFILGILSLVWLTFGIFCFQKHLWAAYAVGSLTALNTVSTLLQGNVGGILVSGIVVWASFSAASKGRELVRRGISLTVRP